MTTKTVEIFRAGTHTGVDGRRYTFTPAQVARIAEVYDPAMFSAPAVIGHPRTDDPAYGWATAMRVQDGVLVADLDRIAPAFAELVQDGRYAKISAAFYEPNDANNPLPGEWYPRHIGFLGAAAPAVKGLAPVAFAEGDDSFVAFASDDALRPFVWMARSMGRVLRRMRDRIIEDDGLEAADREIPEYEIESATDAASRLQAALDEGRPAAFAEASEPAGEAEAAEADDGSAAAEEAAASSPPGDDPAIAARLAELDAREAEIARREAAFAETGARGRRDEDAALIARLVAEGRLPPGHAPQVAAFCERLDGGDLVAFAEGADPVDLRAAFHELLGRLGQTIHFDEVAPSSGARFAEGRSAERIASDLQAEMTAAADAGAPISAAEAAARLRSRS